MSWLQRLRPGSAAPSPSSKGAVRGATEGAAPGMVELVDELSQAEDYSVLDLGQASDESLQAYGRFSRWVRFAGLTGGESTPGSRTGIAARLPTPEEPYDLVFAWDALDRLPAEARRRLVDRLAHITNEGARLHLVLAAPDTETVRPLRFTLVEPGRMRYEPLGRARPGWSRLLPAEVEEVLEPFEVVRRYNLKGGFKEYVAIRRPR